MRAEQAIAALRFAPLIPLWLLVALGVLAALMVALALWRRARGAAWRAAVFAVLLFWLAGPRLVEETRQNLPDIGFVVLDRSVPMQVGQRLPIAEQAARALAEQAARLPDLELRTITVPAEGHGTQMFAAIDRALADVPRARLAGIIALSDGQVHDIPPTPPFAAPFHLLLPARGEETDRRLRIVAAPGYGIVGQKADLVVAVEDLGPVHPPESTARLIIRRDGEPPRVEIVPVGREQRIDIPITRAGPTVVELQAEKLPGEVSELNNRAVITINGVRDRLRVLLVSGEPHPGERTWRRLLKADPSVDLVHFTILRPPEKDDLTPLNELALIAFPVRELFQTKIREFDLIILDRFQNRGILPQAYLRNIADYVRGGGALLMSVGPEFAGITSLAATPLGEVLPATPSNLEQGVTEGPFRPAIAPLGERHPVTAALPGWHAGAPPSWGDWYRRVDVTDLHGQTVMQSPDGAPLLVLDRIEKGRVALLLSDQIWLWSRGHEGGGPQAELLRRAAHWLMKEPELEEEALTARIADGRLLIERRSTDPAPPGAVTVTDPAGAQQSVRLAAAAPGRSGASVPATSDGVWQVSDGARTAFAAADTADPLALSDLRATATKLAPIAQKSGGSVHWLVPAGVPELRRIEAGQTAAGAGWIGLRRNHDHLISGIAALPLLPPWAALTLILGLALLAWRQEGR